MASDNHAHDHSGYQPGQMDISAHQKAWHGFTVFTKWSLIGILAIMAFLAVFRTH
ncbi:MAG TPA: aa3-type cytochrome c oxidase subunit IV [Rhizomicrobium sp.]|jgi:hypothetical protein